MYFMYSFTLMIFVMYIILNHRRLKCWKKPINILLDYWSKLEYRTKQIIDLLLLGAEARCGLYPLHNKAENPTSEAWKTQKKLNEKRKKALASIEDMIQRGNVHNGNTSQKTSSTIIDLLYDTMIQSLNERSKMRQLWQDREADPIFQRLDHEYRPLSLPFVFEYHDTAETSTAANTLDQEFIGKSPLVGSPSGLNSICRTLEKARVAYISCNPSDLE